MDVRIKVESAKGERLKCCAQGWSRLCIGLRRGALPGSLRARFCLGPISGSESFNRLGCGGERETLLGLLLPRSDLLVCVDCTLDALQDFALSFPQFVMR